MIFKHPRFAGAVTLTETIVAMAILAIATLGGFGYQYHAARQARIARAEMTGTRTAQLLLEDWKSVGGVSTYDPSTLELDFSKISVTAGTDTGTALYSITVDSIPMRVTLQWIDRPADTYYTDPVTKIKLREISVTVTFAAASGLAGEWVNIPPVILTTYVRINP
jgi:type II secretory pathway pseudopilin PulG